MDDKQLKEYLAAEENDRKAGQKEIEAVYKDQYIRFDEDTYMFVERVGVRGNYVTFYGHCIEVFNEYIHYEGFMLTDDIHVHNFDKNTGLSKKFQIIEKSEYVKALQEAADLLLEMSKI